MAVIGIIQNGKLEWTSDLDFTQDEKGVWKGSISFHCLAKEVRKLSPQNGSPCPIVGWGFCTLKTKKVSNEKAGVVKVTCFYAGLDVEFNEDEPDQDTATISLDITTKEEPIETHPNYAGLNNDSKEIIAGIKSGNFRLKPGSTIAYIDSSDHENAREYLLIDATAQKLAAFIRKGVESYLNPSTIFRESYKSNKPPTDLGQAGKIQQPPQAPALANGWKWLYLGINSSLDSNGIYNISKEYMAGKWEDELYT